MKNKEGNYCEYEEDSGAMKYILINHKQQFPNESQSSLKHSAFQQSLLTKNERNSVYGEKGVGGGGLNRQQGKQRLHFKPLFVMRRLGPFVSVFHLLTLFLIWKRRTTSILLQLFVFKNTKHGNFSLINWRPCLFSCCSVHTFDIYAC